MRIHHRRRRGATIVECAIVLPILLFFILGTVIGGMGVFRYQELATLASEGARWASVRGPRSELATGVSAATAQDIFDNAIKPRALALDPNKLSYSVVWQPDNQQGSLVTVSVSYRWLPEAIFPSATLKSSATALMHATTGVSLSSNLSFGLRIGTRNRRNAP